MFDAAMDGLLPCITPPTLQLEIIKRTSKVRLLPCMPSSGQHLDLSTGFRRTMSASAMTAAAAEVTAAVAQVATALRWCLSSSGPQQWAVLYEEGSNAGEEGGGDLCYQLKLHT